LRAPALTARDAGKSESARAKKMAGADRIPDDEWRLDEEPLEHVEPVPASAAPTEKLAFNLSQVRLTRAVYVVTAEHLGWYIVAAYALITRTLALGARPLDPAQSTDALAALLIGQHGRAAFALSDTSWVTILQGWIFAAIGASDATSRIVVTLCGLLLIATGFALRPVLGRAGGLAFAALIAISPSAAYFSLAGSTVIASTALMMIAIAIAESMRRRPSVLRAAGLAVAIALWLTADPISYVTASAIVVSLILVGVANLVRTNHRRLRLRVWWVRRRALVIVCTVVAIGLWLVLTTAFFHRPLVPSVQYYFHAAFVPPQIAVHSAIHRIIPILLFYEFIVVALAIIGVFAVVSRGIVNRFAAWSVVWAIVSVAAFASVGANHVDAVVAIVLPLALVAAYAVDWMHGSERWNSIRYALVAVVALTLWVQIITNFVHPAPDTSEASWRRHVLLFWSEPATSIRTVKECERVRNTVSRDARAFIPDDAPQVQWYLRDFTQAASREEANIVVTVGKAESGAVEGNPDPSEFGFEEWWTPDLRKLTTFHAIRYFLTQRAWGDVEIRELGIAIRPQKPNP
jgi:predicted membrane-bound mannosyltransferase